MVCSPATSAVVACCTTEVRDTHKTGFRAVEYRHSRRNSANHERPRQEWIEIPVPALVTEATFALAQEQLEKNKQFAVRRTIVPSLLQGMLVCQHCGYALYRSSTRTPKRKLYYQAALGAAEKQSVGCVDRDARQGNKSESSSFRVGNGFHLRTTLVVPGLSRQSVA